MGGTARGLSAHWAPPSAVSKEKHEQFTPINGREPSSLVLFDFEFGGFSESRNKDKVQDNDVLTTGNIMLHQMVRGL